MGGQQTRLLDSGSVVFINSSDKTNNDHYPGNFVKSKKRHNSKSIRVSYGSDCVVYGLHPSNIKHNFNERMVNQGKSHRHHESRPCSLLSIIRKSRLHRKCKSSSSNDIEHQKAFNQQDFCEMCWRRNLLLNAGNASYTPNVVPRIGSGVHSAFTPVVNKRGIVADKPIDTCCQVLTCGNQADDEMDSAILRYPKNIHRNTKRKRNRILGSEYKDKHKEVDSLLDSDDSSGIGNDSYNSFHSNKNLNKDLNKHEVFSMLNVREIELDSLPDKSSDSRSTVGSTVSSSSDGLKFTSLYTNNTRRLLIPKRIYMLNNHPPRNTVTNIKISSHDRKFCCMYPKNINHVPVNSFLSMKCYQETVL